MTRSQTDPFTDAGFDVIDNDAERQKWIDRFRSGGPDELRSVRDELRDKIPDVERQLDDRKTHVRRLVESFLRRYGPHDAGDADVASAESPNGDDVRDVVRGVPNAAFQQAARTAERIGNDSDDAARSIVARGRLDEINRALSRLDKDRTRLQNLTSQRQHIDAILEAYIAGELDPEDFDPGEPDPIDRDGRKSAPTEPDTPEKKADEIFRDRSREKGSKSSNPEVVIRWAVESFHVFDLDGLKREDAKSRVVDIAESRGYHFDRRTLENWIRKQTQD